MYHLIMSGNAAIRLAEWVLSELREPPTHLKLQKLCFYAYGFGLAEGHGDALGDVHFEAWPHGPVCRTVYDAFKQHGKDPIPTRPRVEGYPERTTDTLRDVLSVYAQLSAWELREQSHLEQPWLSARNGHIDRTALESHFRGPYKAPAYLFLHGGGSLDGIPAGAPLEFETLRAMATELGVH